MDRLTIPNNFLLTFKTYIVPIYARFLICMVFLKQYGISIDLSTQHFPSYLIKDTSTSYTHIYFLKWYIMPELFKMHKNTIHPSSGNCFISSNFLHFSIRWDWVEDRRRNIFCTIFISGRDQFQLSGTFYTLNRVVYAGQTSGETYRRSTLGTHTRTTCCAKTSLWQHKIKCYHIEKKVRGETVVR